MDVWMHACMHVHVYIYYLYVERERRKKEREREGKERERRKRERERRKRERERESLKTTSFLLPVQDHIPNGLLAAVKGQAGGEPVGGRIFAVNAMVEEGATLPEVGKKFNYFGSGIHPSYPFIRSGIIFGVGKIA
jgi:hypothetical protein